MRERMQDSQQRSGTDASCASAPLLTVSLTHTTAVSAEAKSRTTAIGGSHDLLCVLHTAERHVVLSCSSCLQVRGKTVYLQYSTRNEIVNAGGGGGERPSNCLLVTLENLDVRTCLGRNCQVIPPHSRP